jgi:6-phosphogluconolactonase
MPADDGVTSPESAAAAHGSALLSQRWPDDHGLTPTFDLAILGLGPEGSVAGLRPEQPSVHDPRTVTADRPAGRLTLTLTGLSTAREVWLLGSGGGSAAATVLTLSGAGALQVPAAGVRGVQRTLLLLDEAAASRLPPALHRLASP